MHQFCVTLLEQRPIQQYKHQIGSIYITMNYISILWKYVCIVLWRETREKKTIIIHLSSVSAVAHNSTIFRQIHSLFTIVVWYFVVNHRHYNNKKKRAAAAATATPTPAAAANDWAQCDFGYSSTLALQECYVLKCEWLCFVWVFFIRELLETQLVFVRQRKVDISLYCVLAKKSNQTDDDN